MISTKILEAKAAELKKANKKNKKGFTLVELIVVLVIIAILAAILIPTMSGYIGRARKTAAQSDCKTQVTAYAAAITDVLGENASSDLKGDATEMTSINTKAVEYGAATQSVENGLAVKYSKDGSVVALTYKSGSYTATYVVDAITKKSSYKVNKSNANGEAEEAFGSATADYTIAAVTK